ERIREWCAASPVPVEEGKLNVTVSIGVSRLDAAMAGPLDLIAAADAAMYQAKNSGRNRVVVA
ncbi:MAG: diguanylate cyclase, partial [Deltaproteobacteria bacterium]|nr:diguanylate cyclase [Deltaproteobacteria bacterium]